MSSKTIASTTTMKVEVPHVLTLLMLPKELILSCLARVPKLYYPTLTLVSKSFRSLINSPELCKTRSLLDHTESCLYVSLQFQHEHWFTLCRKPYQTIADESQANNYILLSIQSSDSPPSKATSVVAVGSDIYAIGGKVNNVYSSSVYVMDSHSHTWCKAPSMHVARASPSTTVLDGKIYVTSGGEWGKLDYTNCMEVFDTKTQTWEFMPSPWKDAWGIYDYENVALGGSIYVMSKKKSESFKMHKGRWREADLALSKGWRSGGWRCDGKEFCYCVIENVLYCYCCKRLEWYDFIDRQWREVEGVKGLLLRSRKADHNYRLADYGGNLVFLWEEHVRTKDVRNTTLVWCAEISLERRQRREICGTVEWCDVVFTCTEKDVLMHVIATG